MLDFAEPIIAFIVVACEFVGGQLLKIIQYPLDPSQRIYVLFLGTSLLFATFVYLKRHRSGEAVSFVSFLFPRGVWSDPSALLDVRYFFFHQIFRLVIYGSFTAAVITLFTGWAYGTVAPAADPATEPLGPLATTVLVTVGAVVVDFSGYVTHYLQHKVPLLWEFHKVHHSATVLHPLTNYREHPVDNMAYALALGISLALVGAVATLVIGRTPDGGVLTSGGAAVIAYNLLGYNLRHSHIWLKWPGMLPMVFGSPAHHQVHHSCHPDHIDKNFAFMFPVWDVIFGTYVMPEDERDIRFGLGSLEEREYRSCLSLYFLPFVKTFRRLSVTRSPASEEHI
jgi:sterol desaturase/sphingolipid hydroxylase (fatty acid hydroxylase superfamily)